MRRLLLTLLALTMTGVIAVAVSGVRIQRDEPRYRFALVERGDIVRDVSASGKLEAVVRVEVSSQLSGQVAELFADFNDEVRIGQPLARLDAKTFEARVREAQAKLENAKAGYVTAVATTAGAKARYAEAERDLKRTEALHSRGTLSAKMADTARTKKLTADSDLHAAQAEETVKRAAIRIAEATLNQAQIDLERTVIRSPMDGVVIRRSVDLGQTVAASLQAPTLFTIVHDLRRLQVDTFVDEADIGQIHPDQRAEFRVDAYPGRVFNGQVLEIRKAPQLIQNVVTYTVVISADNLDGRLLPGMTAEVRVVVAERRNILKVPNAALRFRAPGSTETDFTPAAGAERHIRRGRLWFQNEDGAMHPVTVELGYDDDSATEIVSGDVDAGQRVAVGFQSSPREGGLFGLQWNF